MDKKFLVGALCCVWLTFSTAFSMAFGQEPVRANQVPTDIRDDFGNRFVEAEKIQWLQQGEQYFGARFELKGAPAEAVYTSNGEWVQTETNIQYRQMPDQARKYCRANYPEYHANKVKKVATRRYGILYEINIRGQQKQIGMTFDMHGKLLEENEEAIEEETGKGLKGKLGKLFRKK